MKIVTSLLFSVLVLYGSAQTKVISGIIKDSHSDERIPFASVMLKNSGFGKLSDSAGSFLFRLSSFDKHDSLFVTYVGYENYSMLLSPPEGDTLFVTILMERGSIKKEVVVRSKYSRGWILWRKVVKKKAENDRYRFENFGYELYNKLEVDLNKINKDKFKNLRPLRPFGFIIDKTVDSTSEERPFLPVFLTETISDYYYQKNPLKRREEIKASRTSGLKNESVQKLLGGMDQNINVYNNYIPIFDKRFISPISDNGDAFYNYRLIDTQYVAGQRLLHLVFTPRHKGENTFEGDCWIHDSTFAVQKMNLRLSKEANVNYVDKLSIVQEYKFVGDSIWFLSKDKFIVDVSAIGKQKFGVTGRKTTTYENISINSGMVWESLRKNKKVEETVLLPGSTEKPEEYWQESRHEDLAKNEKAIYAMIDTLQQMPLFKRYSDIANFLATGYKAFGSFEYGPWFNVISSNVVEGFRLRLDIGTSTNFSKKWWLRGYVAYGFGDQKFKGRAEITHLFKKDPRTRLYLSYSDDYDNGQVYYDEVSQDNIFSLAVRKPNVPIKFLRIQQQKIEFSKETHNGFSVTLNAIHKKFDPVRSLPAKSFFTGGTGEALNNTEFGIRLRFAYLERFLEGTFLRSSLGSPYPISEVRYTRGVSNVFKSNYNYHKISASVSDYQKIGSIGELYYNVYAGRIYGTLPFPLLEIHPGNEIFYYNKYAFNLMNRFEYISDRYAGINLEHNIGNGMFRWFAPTRKLKFRQFWTAKTLWGKLGEDNKKLNFVDQYYDPTVMNGWQPFQTLQDKTYMELGTGVDNILRVFRLDFIWRVLPTGPVAYQKRFGIFGSFRLQF
jgi:hypothetical protein